jgi:hypothetical protein
MSSPPVNTATVFVVQHQYDLDGCDETKFIGVYASRASAEAVVHKLRGQPGFRDHPGDFSIDEYELDRDHWEEGFITD